VPTLQSDESQIRRAAVDRDRRSSTERIIGLARWLTLALAAVVVNIPPGQIKLGAQINLIIGAWALFGLTLTLLLLKGHLPGVATQLAMLAFDIAAAGSAVYVTGGVKSGLAFTFFLPVVGASLRFGIAGSLVVGAVSAGCDIAFSFWARGQDTYLIWPTLTQRIFLYLIVALSSGLLARESLSSRARQVERSFELEHATSNELREIDRIKSEFMMLASHELRTPLTKIKAWLTLMQDIGDKLPAAQRDEGLRELRAEAEHLARLTDNLLCIAQLESGEIRLRSAPLPLEDLLNEVVSRFIETADRERFVIDIAPDAHSVLADQERIAIVLACLVDNALKFSPEDESVRITAQRVVTRVHIEIHDNGKRIPDSHLDRVFASFYQVEAPLVRQRGGFGVGLYLARQLTERMGGKVWIDNSRSRGNTFVVALPIHV
jgi:signal transduction histidine kinase